MTTLYPMGYGTRLVTLEKLQDQFNVNLGIELHPAFKRRIWPFLESQDGKLGIGSGARLVQPVRPGFAPPGKSFHEAQLYASGFQGYTAFDLVATNPGRNHRAPAWSEVPVQGSAWAERVGVHCNIGTPGQAGSESWHLQCVEQDSYQDWVSNGRKDPVLDYPLPDTQPIPPPQPPGDDEVTYLAKVHADDNAALCVTGHVVSWVPTAEALASVEQIATNDRNTMVVLTSQQRAGMIWVGQQPFYGKGSIAGEMRCRADLFGAQS